MNYLHTADARQRRDSRVGGPFGQAPESTSQAENTNDQQQITPSDDSPASPLQEASKLLDGLNADVQLNYKNLEHINDMNHRNGGVLTTPPPDSRSQPRATTSAASSSSIGYAKLHNGPDLDPVVYPIGQINGIDPMYPEHIHNIPYPMPSKESEMVTTSTAPIADRKKSTQVDPGWVRSPQILLVEDDPTCRRIGRKFLYSFHCAIDSAVSTWNIRSGRETDSTSSTVSKRSIR